MRKGVSPIIAVLLLIVIAVAAAVLAYIWIVSYTGTLEQQAGTQQLQERIKIEGVEYDGTTLTIYVRNIGEVDVTVDAAYIFDASGTVIDSATGLGVTLTPGQVSTAGQVTIDGGLTLNDGSTYTVKVVTDKGTEATYVFTYRA